MIQILAMDGQLIKTISQHDNVIFGFHRQLGWVTAGAAAQRLKSRTRHGLKAHAADWICQLKVDEKNELVSLDHSATFSRDGAAWQVSTLFADYRIRVDDKTASVITAVRVGEETKDERNIVGIMAASLVALLAIYFASAPGYQPTILAPELVEPMVVKIRPQPKSVAPVSIPAALSKIAEQLRNQSKKTQVAVAQNLGFLSLIGKKELTKAIGGMPTSLPGTAASPGAGAGGTEGSGGELLVGLGRGVKQTTVGNSGVSGLGGIGTKGRGGGGGGYGTSMLGSGEGKALSSIPLAQDIVLEGGLDRSVIQATIAKYLSQVRYCYENGLRKRPGLSGQVTMAFEINAEGAIALANVSRSSLGDHDVEMCISTRMLTWQFPRPLGGVSVKVSYPFMLKPVTM